MDAAYLLLLLLFFALSAGFVQLADKV